MLVLQGREELPDTTFRKAEKVMTLDRAPVLKTQEPSLRKWKPEEKCHPGRGRWWAGMKAWCSSTGLSLVRFLFPTPLLLFFAFKAGHFCHLGRESEGQKNSKGLRTVPEAGFEPGYLLTPLLPRISEC